MTRLEKEFSQDFQVFTLVTSELKLASLYELQTHYNTEDLYDMLELLDAYKAMRDVKEDSKGK
jgi:hypothetical protein